LELVHFEILDQFSLHLLKYVDLVLLIKFY